MKHGLIVSAFLLLFSVPVFPAGSCGTKDPYTTTNSSRLIVHTNKKQIPYLWNDKQKQNLTFCISDKFKDDKENMVSAILEAVEEWEGHANIDLIYLPEHDSNCSKRNKNVLFRIVVTNSRRFPFAAKAFFPGAKQKERFVIFKRSFVQKSYRSLVRLAKHELGHVLGFRHEHINPNNPSLCEEDENYTPLTDYDPYSIMNYARCGGKGGSYLSKGDQLGASIAYP